MNLEFVVPGRSRLVRRIDLGQPRNLLLIAAAALLGSALVFAAGLQFGRFLAGPWQAQSFARTLEEQRLELQAARSQLQGKVDAMATRVGTLNAHLIRLDALGRRVAELADLDRGEFNFDLPPPVGGPEGSADHGGSAQAPELSNVLDALEAQLEDRQRQLMVLENLMSSRELGQRIQPSGWPLIGGWISSHFGYRTDPITGQGSFHRGVDFAGAPGSKVIAVGPGVVSFAGYKDGYGYLVEVTHPTGYMTRYGHNSRNLVRMGQTVGKGQPIAIIGSTGRSTGTHVHFEVERDGKAQNPIRYLDTP